MARKRQLQIFKEAKKRGSFDEYPVLSESIDPQLHVSKSVGTQPFYLVCEKDTVLAQLSGEARVEFKDTPVLNEDLSVGDYVYVPAGTPHRIAVDAESIYCRYKAREAGLEGVAWYCDNCGNEVHRVVWDTQNKVSQQAYMELTSEFNENASLRTCSSCGQEHPQVDTGNNNWAAIAEELNAS